MPTEVSETVRINTVLKFLYSIVNILECMTSAKSGCVRTYQMNLTNVSLISHNPFYHDPCYISVSCTTVIQFIIAYFLYSYFFAGTYGQMIIYCSSEKIKSVQGY